MGETAEAARPEVRVVLDANVLASALLSPEGPPGRIVARHLRREGVLVLVSEAIVEEAARILAYPRIARRVRPGLDPALWLADVVAASRRVDPGEPPPVCRDPDDDKYLAAAMRGRADCLVTGDDDLLALGEFGGIPIVTPRRLLDLIEGRPPR